MRSGIAHAMKKEFIMIMKSLKNKPDFPFDISHIDILGYIYDPLRWQKLEKDSTSL